MGSPDIVVRDPKDLTPPTGAHYVKPLTLTESMSIYVNSELLLRGQTN
jgi:hypothetical protein